MSRRCLGAAGRGRRPRSAAAGGQRRIVFPRRPARSGRAGRAAWGRPALSGSSRPAFSGEISLGADVPAFETHSDSSWSGSHAEEEGDRGLQLASLAAEKTHRLCFSSLEKWTKTVKSVEVRRNKSSGRFEGASSKHFIPWHVTCFTSPAPPGAWCGILPFLVCGSIPPPNVDSKGLVPSLSFEMK